MRALLATSLGGAGHLEPVAAVGRALRAEGHDTDLLVPPMLADAAGRSGLHVVVGDEPPGHDVAAIFDRMAAGPPEAVAGLVDRELFARRCTEAMLPAATALLAHGAYDVVLRETCEYASAVAGLAAGVPVASVAISQARLERDVLEMVAGIIDGFGDGTAAGLAAAPYLTSFPERLDPSPWARTVRYRVARREPVPLPDWWPGDDRPLVYVTFGSVVAHTGLADARFRGALDAVATLDARVLLTVGRSFDPKDLGALPDGVHAERWVDQDDVVATCALVVCHGGSGTTLGALRAGVPLVVAPLYADNARNGAAIEAIGAGLVADVAALGEAAARVLATPSFRAAARSVRDEMAAYPRAAAAVAALG